MPVIWVWKKQEYFYGEDWTGRIALIRFEKFGFARTVFSPSLRANGSAQSAAR
jgi:hypothetical protein